MSGQKKKTSFFDRIHISRLGLNIVVINIFSFIIQIGCVSDFINTPTQEKLSLSCPFPSIWLSGEGQQALVIYYNCLLDMSNLCEFIIRYCT